MSKRTILNTKRPAIETRDSGKPMITGYGAVFYNGTPETEFQLWKGYVERVGKSAFDRALREDDVRACFNHNANMIMGRLSAGTLRLSVDDVGLRYEIDPPDTDNGRSIVEAVKRGDVSDSSFMFTTLNSSTDKLGDGRMIETLNDVRLYEVGPVVFPAYEGTTSEVRSEAKARHNEHMASLKANGLTLIAEAMRLHS